MSKFQHQLEQDSVIDCSAE